MHNCVLLLLWLHQEDDLVERLVVDAHNLGVDYITNSYFSSIGEELLITPNQNCLLKKVE